MGGDQTLKKLLPGHAGTCPHVLAKWMLRTAKSSATRADGTERPTAQRGGTLIRTGAGCVYAPGHTGEHRNTDGWTWS